MPDMVRITCVSPSSVSVEDVGVRLVGRGAYADVLRSTADASGDLRAAVSRRQVSVRPIPASGVRPLLSSPSMPIWPFATPASSVHERPTVASPPPSSDREVVSVLRQIDGKLSELLSRPAPSAPEVVAAHVKAASVLTRMPPGLPGGPAIPGPGSSSEPQFIPSRILPESAESDIRVRESVVDTDVDSAAAALRKVRRKP